MAIKTRQDLLISIDIEDANERFLYDPRNKGIA